LVDRSDFSVHFNIVMAQYCDGLIVMACDDAAAAGPSRSTSETSKLPPLDCVIYSPVIP
jgi:hypothetical protein